MRRLQLLGKSKYFQKNNSNNQDSDCYNAAKNTDDRSDTKPHERMIIEDEPPEEPSKMNLFSLPPNILLTILDYLDNESLITLCTVNLILYKIVSNNFLYKDVKLNSKLSLLKFNALIHSEFHTINVISCGNPQLANDSENARFLTRSIEFINPQCQDSLLKYSKYYNKDGGNSGSVIAGSYSFSNNQICSTVPYLTNNAKSSRSKADNNILKSVSSSGSSKKGSKHDDLITSPLIPNGISSSHKTATNKKTLQFLETLNKLEYKYSHYTYIELMLDIIDYLPNLSHIILSEVEPNFKIPLWYSVFNDGSKDFFRKIIKGQQSMNNNDLRTFQISEKFLDDYEKKFYCLQRFKTLEIRAISEPRKKTPLVPLRPNLLCCFGIINELILENVIIDTGSLDTPMEFLPLYLKKEPSSDLYNLHSTYNKLTLKQCHIVPGNGILKLFHRYFEGVKSVSLLSVSSKFDLLLCNCFPSLNDLTIDCSSMCFSDKTLVDGDDYYYKDIDENGNEELSDTESMSETLLDEPIQRILQAPPPTTAAVVSLNLNYINRTTNDKKSAMMNKKPSMITKAQGEFFQMSRIPAFHYCYHYYKRLFDRIPSKNVNINIINIPFTNVHPLSPISYWEKVMKSIASNDQDTLIAYGHTQLHANPNSTNNNSLIDVDETRNLQYQWDQSILNCMKDGLSKLKKAPEYHELDIVSLTNEIDLDDKFNNFQNYQNYLDIPNVNLYFFLKQLSKFKSVNIKLFRKWLFCTPRTRYDWELLLKPVLNVNVPIEVRDRDGFMVYSYGTSNSKQMGKSNSNIVV